MGNLSSREAAIMNWLDAQGPAMMELLAGVVNIDSGSYNKPGVDEVGRRFAEFFESHGISTSTIASDTYGDAIVARTGDPSAATARALMMGHRDTVFPDGEASRRPFRRDGDRAYGPGIADMKGGLVMNAFVLAALHEVGETNEPVRALFTSDEEVGSPFSRRVIEDEASRASIVLNSEPGRVSGNVVTRRKGGVLMRFEVLGKAAHSGGNFKDGISAIGEIAHKIVALHELTDFETGTTVNVGLVKGGQSVNTTAPSATGNIDLRFVTPSDREAAIAAIQEIMENSTVPGTSAALEVTGEFLPLVPTEDSTSLFESYRAAAGDIGISLEGEFTGACADAGFAAGVGTPTLCGLGPVGGKAHTPDEYIEVDTLVSRAQAAALTIVRHGR